MCVTTQQFETPNEEFQYGSFMAQERMRHPMERRMRDAGRGETKENEHVVRKMQSHRRRAMVKLESGQETGVDNQPRGLEEIKTWSPKRGVGCSL